MSTNDRFRELCAGLHLGGLDAEELAELRALLDTAGEREWRLLGEIEAAALHLATSAPAADPPPELRQRLRSRLRATRSTAGPDAGGSWADRLGPGRPRRTLVAWAALLALVVGSGVVSTLFYLRAERAEEQVAELEAEIGGGGSLLELLRSPQVEMVTLEGTELRPESHGKVVWDAATRTGVLQLSGLPPSAAGRVYQLWVFPRDGAPWSAGVFELEESSPGTFFPLGDFDPGAIATLKGFLVTVEEGAAEQPGDIWVLGARLGGPAASEE